ncbi:ABC transporter A family member 7-like protein, partial [Trifolium pratense]
GKWIICMELYPGFALYRGLWEFAQSAITGNDSGTDGMRWPDLSDSTNGMKEGSKVLAHTGKPDVIQELMSFEGIIS